MCIRDSYNIGILIGKDDSPALVAEKLREVAENGSRYLEARSRSFSATRAGESSLPRCV